MTGRSRSFVFTMFDYADTIEEDLRRVACVYMVAGAEVCPDTGRLHIQGYVYFKHARSFNSVRLQLQSINPGAHVEMALGNAEQNTEYCTKDGHSFSVGIMPMSHQDKGDAETERWDDARAAAESGNWDAIPSDIMLRNASGLRWVHSLAMESRPLLEIEGDFVNEWIWGDPGTGKSKRARLENPVAWPKPLNKWWNGYKGQDVVIIDDIDPNHSGMRSLLKVWSDRYPFICESKGGNTMIRPKKIVVTSQYPISAVFTDHQTQLAMLRRFTERHFTEPYVHVRGQDVVVNPVPEEPGIWVLEEPAL